MWYIRFQEGDMVQRGLAKQLFGLASALAVALLLATPVKVGAAEVIPATPEHQLLMQQAAAAQAAAAQQAAAQQVALDVVNAQLAEINRVAMAQQAAMQKQAAEMAAAQEKAAQEAAAAAQKAAAQKAAEDAAAATGMTYVDVNLTDQTLTYFVNGAVALFTPCVTGGPRNSTPRGVFAINTMTPGKYLTGPTWHVWVNRWMRFCGNCGIHDASWRKSFGGDIYLRNGSHGCVNIPRDKANELYNMVGLGTVVIVH